MSHLTTKLINRGLPTIAGFSLIWIIKRVIDNEPKLIARQMELENALGSNSWKVKKSLLRGKNRL